MILFSDSPFSNRWRVFYCSDMPPFSISAGCRILSPCLDRGIEYGSYWIDTFKSMVKVHRFERACELESQVSGTSSC